MTHLRLILLTTTAIAALQGSQFSARADTSSLSSFVLAQAEPAAPPKAAPAPPKAAPPPPPPVQKSAPVAPPTAPPAVQRTAPTPPTPPAPPAPVQRTAPTPSSVPAPAPATAPSTPPVAPGVRDVTPPRAPLEGERRGPPPLPNSGAPGTPSTPPVNEPRVNPNGTLAPAAPPVTTPNVAPTTPGGGPGAPGGPRTEERGGGPRGPNISPPAMQTQKPPAVTAPLPTLQSVAPAQPGGPGGPRGPGGPGGPRGPGGPGGPGAPNANAPLAPIAPSAAGVGPSGERNINAFRGERREQNIGGRTVISEPGRIIIKDPNGQSFVRHNEVDRFRIGARDVRVTQEGINQRTVVVRPDGSQIITINDRDGRLQRRVRRGLDGREIIIIDNTRRGPVGIGGFFVALPPPFIRIPRDRYIVDYEDAPPQLIYDTLYAPPVDVIERPYTLDEIRYSPSVRERMPSIDIDTINFETGSWEIPPDQAESLRVIADGMNQAIQRNPRTVFLIEGHTDAVGNDTDNLSLSDRRAESAAALLTQQFGVPAENLTSQGYGEQYLKVDTQGPERRNRRVTIRNITPLLNGGQASLPPPPPGVGPGGR